MLSQLNSLRPRLKLIGLGLATAALVSLSWTVGAVNNRASAQPQAVSYMYAVKIVCVPTFGKASPALVPGMYRTAVNVHNPWPQPAHIVKWVTLSPPQGQAAIIGERISETLEPFQAFDIDCVHMAEDFGLPGQRVPGGKGFLLIQADQDIDVVGVYTAEELVEPTAGETTEETAEELERTGRGPVGVGLGMDVEYIQPKIAQAPTPSVVCVDFEAPLTVGTQYGMPAGQSPGDLAFTTNNIPVSVYDFNFIGGGGTFNLAQIDPASATFGNGQIIRMNNINLEFDFSGLGFQTAQVTFEFLDLGGFENLSVNASPIFAGELSSAPTPIGGVTLAVTTVPVTGGNKGTATLRGVVTTLRIGGQEFWIDQVCASQ